MSQQIGRTCKTGSSSGQYDYAGRLKSRGCLGAFAGWMSLTSEEGACDAQCSPDRVSLLFGSDEEQPVLSVDISGVDCVRSWGSLDPSERNAGFLFACIERCTCCEISHGRMASHATAEGNEIV